MEASGSKSPSERDGPLTHLKKARAFRSRAGAGGDADLA